MKIDRNTPEGKMLDELQAMADSMAGTPKGDFINQCLAYMEASEVISQTLPPDEAGKAILKLHKTF